MCVNEERKVQKLQRIQERAKRVRQQTRMGPSGRNPSGATLCYRALMVPKGLFRGKEPPALVTEELADLPVFSDFVS